MEAFSSYLEALKKTPQYQRALSKLVTKAPSNAAVVSTAALDAGLAGLAAKNTARDFQAAAKERNAAAEIGLRKQALADKLWEIKAKNAFRDEQSGKLATLGAAQLGLSGLMGVAKLREDDKTRAQLDELGDFIKKRRENSPV